MAQAGYADLSCPLSGPGASASGAAHNLQALASGDVLFRVITNFATSHCPEEEAFISLHFD